MDIDANKLVEQLKPAAEALASTLGTTADNLIRFGIKGMVAEGIAEIMVALLVVGLFGLFFRWSWKESRAKDADDSVHIMALFSGASTAVASLFIPFIIYDGILKLAAPEYALMKEILRALK